MWKIPSVATSIEGPSSFASSIFIAVHRFYSVSSHFFFSSTFDFKLVAPKYIYIDETLIYLIRLQPPMHTNTYKPTATRKCLKIAVRKNDRYNIDVSVCVCVWHELKCFIGIENVCNLNVHKFQAMTSKVIDLKSNWIFVVFKSWVCVCLCMCGIVKYQINRSPSI